MAEAVSPSDIVRNAVLMLGNGIRLLRAQDMDYVVFDLRGPFAERSQGRRHRFPISLLPWPAPPPSIEDFCRALERVAADRRVKGVLFLISQLDADLAALFSLCRAITRFRECGKRAVAYLHELSLWTLVVASACDQVLAPESGSLASAGLRSEVVFLKDTLALLGIQADLEAIAEYKVSPDRYRRSQMSEPHREMLDAILESVWGSLVGALAEGRGRAPEQIVAALDAAPLPAREAQRAGLLDGVCYEDELPARLGSPSRPAVLAAWKQARRSLTAAPEWHARRAIGVISVEGLIVSGPSRRPPTPLPLPLPMATAQAGAETLIAQLRAARSRHLAAVVLHIDSPGGSALASDRIAREVAVLARTKPVVVYMGSQAASGGYYVAAPARAIVAQPTTLTGSIGIWGGKVVTQGLYDRLHARRVAVSRGRTAGIYSSMAPFDDDQRARVRAEIGVGYARFKDRVAQGRGLPEERVEAIARGRVWTGAHALSLNLIDQIGDFHAAVLQARELAGIPGRRAVRVVPVAPPHEPRPPALADAAAWLAGLRFLAREGAWAMAPWELHLRG